MVLFGHLETAHQYSTILAHHRKRKPILTPQRRIIFDLTLRVSFLNTLSTSRCESKGFCRYRCSSATIHAVIGSVFDCLRSLVKHVRRVSFSPTKTRTVGPYARFHIVLFCHFATVHGSGRIRASDG